MVWSDEDAPYPGTEFNARLSSIHGEVEWQTHGPHEAETVNSQVRPVTLCLQVGPCVSVTGRLSV